MLSILISYALEPIVVDDTRIRLPRVLAVGAGRHRWSPPALGYAVYSLSDDATAIVAQLPDAAQSCARDACNATATAGAIQQVSRRPTELQKTADEAAGTNPAPRGVQRVQIEEPAINIRQYLSRGARPA